MAFDEPSLVIEPLQRGELFLASELTVTFPRAIVQFPGRCCHTGIATSAPVAGAQIKAPRKPGRSQNSTGQCLIRQRPWSA
jgi:hypothetical protein